MRSKKLVLLAIVFLFSFSACKNWQNKFTVVGDIHNMPQQKVILEELGVNDVITIVDSTRSDENGKFELSGNAPEAALYRLHFTKGKFILLSIDKGNLKLTGNWDDLREYKVAGSPSSESLHRFILAIEEHVRDFNTMKMVLDTLQKRGNDSITNSAMKDFENMRQSFTQFVEQYADTTTSLPNAVFAARILNPRTEGPYLAGFTQGLERRFPKSKVAQDFINYFNMVSASSNQPAPPSGPAVGTMAPDINLTTPDGKTVALSSLRGKYVLLDFWASWCGPCRAENPNVVAAYDKYKDKNFTVYSVSLDSKKDKWTKAIQEDGLTWTHVSDLKGWESVAAREYDIQAIPSNFLIDPSGKIIARNLRGDALQDKLKEILK